MDPKSAKWGCAVAKWFLPDMARSRSFTHSVVLGVAGQAITMFAGLWLGPFLLQHIGSRGYGLWIVGQQLLVYLTLFDFGVVAILPRETAYAAGQEGGATKIAQLMGRTARIVLWQTGLVAIFALALWMWMPANWSHVRLPMGIAAAAFAVLFPTRMFRGVLEGLQDLAFISWSYMAGWFAGLVISVGLVAGGYGLRAFAIGWAVNQAVDALLCAVRLRMRFPQVWPGRWAVGDGDTLRSQLSRGLWASVSQIAQVLIYGTDAAVIGRLFGPAAVVPYNCTGKLINALANQPQHVMRAAEPGLSQLRATESRDRLVRVTGALSLAMLMASGAVVVFTLAVNPGFVRWWIGDAFYGGLLLTVLFGASMLLRHLNITVIYTLFAFRHEHLLAWTSLADGVMSTIFSILLAWALHSPVGVVLGSMLSTCVVLLWGNGPRLARELGVSVIDLGKPLGGWFWRMALAGSAASLLGNAIEKPTPVAIAALGVFAVATYCLLMFPVALRSALRPYLEPYLTALRSRRLLRRIAWAQ